MMFAMLALPITAGELSDNLLGQHALHEASKLGDLQGVKMLIEAEEDINLVDYRGWRPIHYAAKEGHKDIVEYLVENGADIHAKNNDGDRPIDCAVRGGHEGTIIYLVKKGAYEKSSLKHAYVRQAVVIGFTLSLMPSMLLCFYMRNWDRRCAV